MASAPIIKDAHGIDAKTGQGLELSKPQLRLIRSDAKTQQDRRITSNRMHFDAQGLGNGLHMARQLEHIYEEVIKEEFPPQNALELFEVDNSVAPGARSHTARRISQQGEARVYRGNSRDIPRVGVTQDEETFPVRHYVTSFEVDIFEQLSSSYAGTRLKEELREASQEVLMEFWNEKTWFGDSENGIYGVLNYLWTPKMFFPVKASPESDPKEFLFFLDKAAAFAHEESKTVYSPDYAVTSPRVRRYMARTQLPDYSDGTKVLEDFLDGNQRIQGVGEAWELAGAGPGGTDVMIFFRRTRRSIANCLVQSPQMLPIQRDGFAEKVYLYMSHGGVLMRDVLNVLVCSIDASDM